MPIVSVTNVAPTTVAQMQAPDPNLLFPSGNGDICSCCSAQLQALLDNSGQGYGVITKEEWKAAFLRMDKDLNMQLSVPAEIYTALPPCEGQKCCPHVCLEDFFGGTGEHDASSRVSAPR